MIKFYGIFQLVKVTKTAKTTKTKELVVYLTCASRRTKEESDFKLFKAYGKNAERFLENLEQKSDGTYISRKLHIEGYVETYKKTITVECKAKLNPTDGGPIIRKCTVKTQGDIEVFEDVYVINHFEFLDSKSKNSKNTQEDDDEYGEVIVVSSDNSEDDEEEKKEVAATSISKKSTNIARNNVNKSMSKKAFADIEMAEEKLSGMKSNGLSSLAESSFKNINSIDDLYKDN